MKHLPESSVPRTGKECHLLLASGLQISEIITGMAFDSRYYANCWSRFSGERS